MNLQEQIQRIHQMMGLLNESTDKIADEILDKLFDENNLNFLEKKYLNLRSESLKTGKSDKKEEFLNKIKKTKETIDNFWEFDPTEDEALEDLKHNLAIELDDLENMKYQIIYDNPNLDIDDFIDEMNIPFNEISFEGDGYKAYDDLSEEITKKWKDYIDAYRFFPL
jgi:hypothetical protein